MRASRWLVVAAALGAAACRDAGPVDADGDCVAAGVDCDDANPAVSRSTVGYRDGDGDGVGEDVTNVFCTDRLGTLPPLWAATSTDCAPGDRTAWRAVANPVADRDGDGYTAVEAVTLCVGVDLPAPYVPAAHGADCDDGDPATYRWATLYTDGDADGVGACPRAVAWSCVGAALPAGFAAVGCDPDDGDPAITAAPVDEAVLSFVVD